MAAATPVISGFFPDPSVCRVGDDFYVACSSFEYFPGLPILRSRDLRIWTHVANALDRPEQLPLDGVPASGGVFAPTLRHHHGRFWLATSEGSSGHILLFTTQRAEGPWSLPIVVLGATGIDPDLAWDRDGNCHLTWADSQVGRSGRIVQARVEEATGRLLEPPREIWSGTGLQHPEAPHLYEIAGTWYVVIAEGGTERGHAVSIARGRTPTGPFEGHPGNPVLSHRSTDDPVQSVGHADLTQTADGRWWALLHGTRPRGISPGFHVLGRETFLCPVEWQDGWPRIGPPNGGDAGPRAFTDDFDAAPLGPAWLSLRAPAPHSLSERAGWLTLHATAAGLEDPGLTLAARRQQHPACTVRARVDATRGSGGLAVRIDEHHVYAVEADADGIHAHVRIGPLARQFARTPLPQPSVLRIDIEPGAARANLRNPAPDTIRLGYERSDTVQWLAELDGRYLSTEVAGGFTGRVLALFATCGTVAFDWLSYTGRDSD